MLATYEAGGSTDVNQYNELTKRSKELNMLSMAEYGLAVTRPQVIEENSSAKLKTPYDILAPEGSFQRGVLEKTSIIPGGLTIGTQLEMGSLVSKDISGGNYGNIWKSLNAPVSKQYAFALPDISNVSESDISKGLTVAGTISNPFLYPVLTSKEGRITTEFVSAAGKEMYTRSREYPLENVAFAAIPGGFKIGENLVSRGIAKSTVTPGLKTVGRVMSSPVATDIGQYVLKGALILPWVYESGRNIYDAPMTPAGKGKAVGQVGYQVAWMGAGVGVAEGIKLAQPQNEFYGKGFFSKKPEIGPAEKIMFKAETTVRSFSANQPAAYREVATITPPGRVIEPAIKAEPDFSVLTTSGKYATEIKATLIEQPHIVIGSSSTIQQYPKGISESTGLRVGKDVDTLIESPTKALYSLSEKTGLKVMKTPEGKTQIEGGVLDPHPIPQNIPGFKPSVEAELDTPGSSVWTSLFGDPYRRIAFPRGSSEIITPKTRGYSGELSYEAAQVQFGRKASGVALFVENPTKYGYRGEKDVYDFVSTYQAQKLVAVSKGTPESAFTKSDIAMKSFMERTFTYGTEKGQRLGDSKPTVTRSVKDIYETMRTKTKENAQVFERTGELPTEPEYSPRSNIARSGAISSTPASSLSVIPFGISIISSPRSNQPSEQSPRYSVSSPRSSLIPPSQYPVSPSRTPASRSISPPASSEFPASFVPSRAESPRSRAVPVPTGLPSTPYTPASSKPPRGYIPSPPSKTPSPKLQEPPYKIAPPTIIPGEGGWLPPGGGRGSPQRGYGLRSAVATHPVGADLLGVSRDNFQPMRMGKGKKPKGMQGFKAPKF